jgi:hypothetical protein
VCVRRSLRLDLARPAVPAAPALGPRSVGPYCGCRRLVPHVPLRLRVASWRCCSRLSSRCLGCAVLISQFVSGAVYFRSCELTCDLRCSQQSACPHASYSSGWLSLSCLIPRSYLSLAPSHTKRWLSAQSCRAGGSISQAKRPATSLTTHQASQSASMALAPSPNTPAGSISVDSWMKSSNPAKTRRR